MIALPHGEQDGSGEVYVTGTGQRLIVHTADKCAGEHCVIHNPSRHGMRDWPTHYRGDRGIMERLCYHGAGHPDPDTLAFIERLHGSERADAEGVHGCDGCCGAAHRAAAREA